MKKIIAISMVASTLMFGANSDYEYEITPMIGGTETEANMDIDDQFNFGVSFGKNLANDQMDYFFDQLEIGILRTTKTDYYNTNGDTTLHKFFVNGVKDIAQLTDITKLYGLVGVGYETFSDEQPWNDNEDNGFVNYGLGLKMQMTDNLALKLDARHLVDFDTDSTFLYTLGLAIAFGETAQPEPQTAPEPEPTPVVEKPTPAPVVDRGNMDDDNDGVLNKNDRCPNSDPSDIVDKNGCEQRVNLNVKFGFDSTDITNRADNKIEDYAEFMKENPQTKATLKGHTDSIGTEEYNQKLSEQRANAVKSELEDLGVDSNRLKAVGYGEARPLYPNDTKENRAKNRRVDAVLSK